MKTMRERFGNFLEETGLGKKFNDGEHSIDAYGTIDCGAILDFIEQELKKEREEIVEMIKELAEPYEGAKWLNQVNPETIINTIKNRT